MGIDVGTQLVQAYLQANGYFTVTDYPLIERLRTRGTRSVTDLDMLAVRFPGYPQKTQLAPQSRILGPVVAEPDSALACPSRGTDMIVAEVKQGKARVNPASRNPAVLAAALVRFGCCHPEHAESVVKQLMQRGKADTHHGHQLRMVLFASSGDHAPPGWHLIHLERIFLFLNKFLDPQNTRWQVTDFHDPALAWLALLRKSGLSPRREDTTNP